MEPVKLLAIENIVFLDIETVPEVTVDNWSTYSKADIWERKYCNQKSEDISASERYWERAGLFPEFAKIVCISLGYIKNSMLCRKSYMGEEKDLLSKFSLDVEQLQKSGRSIFGGHNIISFDIPFLMKRFLMNDMLLPRSLGFINKKPWEVKLIDTMKLRKFTGGTSTSLEALCHSLGITSPKTTMSGADVKDVYYGGDEFGEKERMERIKTYCEADIIATSQCYQKLYSLICY